VPLPDCNRVPLRARIGVSSGMLKAGCRRDPGQARLAAGLVCAARAHAESLQQRVQGRRDGRSSSTALRSTGSQHADAIPGGSRAARNSAPSILELAMNVFAIGFPCENVKGREHETVFDEPALNPASRGQSCSEIA
jgi:hypothetical protein